MSVANGERARLLDVICQVVRPGAVDFAGPGCAGDHHEYLERMAANAGGQAFVLCVANPALSQPAALGHGGPWSDICHYRAVLSERFGRVQEYSLAGEGFKPGYDRTASRLAFVCADLSPPRRPVKVSVVMPLYNRAGYTAKALQALAGHTTGDFELILIDNASTDQTRTLLAGLGGDVAVHRNHDNLGFAKACNQGALLARGEIVVFLNNDTEVQPGWLHALVDELDANPCTGVCGGRLLYPDGTVQHAGVAVGRDLVPMHVHRGLPGGDPKVMERREFPIVTGACMAVRREEFLRLGMFDEAFVNGHEDIDLCMRYARAGKRVIYRPDCVVTHHESVSDGRMDHRQENLARTMNKWRYDLVQDDFTYGVRLAERKTPGEPLVFALKIGPPDRTADNWGDIYFAEDMAKALYRAGHECRIHYLDEWGRGDLDVDVVIHLAGLSKYRPKPWNVNIMWLLNHPEMHDHDDMNRYDAVLPASTAYAGKLAGELDVLVKPLLQATNPERFRPQGAKPQFDMVFVGNQVSQAGHGGRRIVAAMLPLKRSLAVWGQGWDGILPTGVWQGCFVPNEELPEVYAKGRLVLNDHQPGMREHGFVNNRVFDATACGCVVLSDVVEGIGEVLDVPRAGNPGGLQRLAEELLADPAKARAKAEEIRRQVLARHTFDHRATEILQVLDELKVAFARAARAKRYSMNPQARKSPLVSVLMATHNRPDYLPRAVRSVLGQTYANLELILVNDGGPSVAGLIREIGDARVTLMELPENRGKAHAINQAFAISRGTYVAHLDDDDIWFPDHLETLLLALETIPGVDMAYSDAYKVELDSDGSEVSREVKYHHQAEIYDLLENNQITGISVVHRRELFTRAGGMDESLSVLIDWDLWRRMAALTMPHHVSKATAEYYLRGGQAISGQGHLTNMHDADRSRYFAHRARIINKRLGDGSDARLEKGMAFYRKRSRAEFLAVRGDWHAAQGRWQRAERAYKLAAKIAPGELSVLRRLGHFSMRHGRPGDAVQAFAKAAALPYAAQEDHFNLAVALAHCGSISQGQEVIDAMKKRFHSTPEAVAAVERFWNQVLSGLDARATLGARGAAG